VISKHQRWTPDNKWIPGKCRVLSNPSLRKMMRAARTGNMPDERQVTIDLAMQKAAKRKDAYLNSSPAKRAYEAAQAERLARRS